uniref:F-box domain-containing protein n=1 Tax=Leersia perrieri TaxID=77586 RepID=A0A0D9XHS1_9ORYZ
MSEVTGGNFSSPAAAAESAPDDVLAEILLRLPPHPSFLSHACLVCKRWRRLTRDPGFLRRLRAFHRTPPVLGFFHNSPGLPSFVPAEGPSGRIATEASSLRRDGEDGMWWFVDCRHGRALLRSRDWAELLVWDPMTGDRRCITVPEQMQEGAFDRSAAVFCCTASGGEEDCHSSPFHLVFVFTSHGRLFACVYSSRIGSWGDLVSAPAPSSCELYDEPPALVGEALYWLVNDGSCILEFQFGSQSLNLIEQPVVMHSNNKRNIRLVSLEDDVLGLAFIKDSNLHLWARVVADDCASKWIPHRAIELDKLLTGPMVTLPNCYRVMPVWINGFSEDGNVVFLRTLAGIFFVSLETLKINKMSSSLLLKTLYPYASFYVPKVLLLLLCSYVFQLLSDACRRLPPGPRPLPVIGNLLDFAGRFPHRSLACVADKYGPLVTLRLGTMLAVVASSLAMAQDAWRTEGHARGNLPVRAHDVPQQVACAPTARRRDAVRRCGPATRVRAVRLGRAGARWAGGVRAHGEPDVPVAVLCGHRRRDVSCRLRDAAREFSLLSLAPNVSEFFPLVAGRRSAGTAAEDGEAD